MLQFTNLNTVTFPKNLAEARQLAESIGACDNFMDLIDGAPSLSALIESSKPRDWAYLIQFCPQFADRCDFRKLKGYECARLLRSQPQFADRCDSSKLTA